jgi:phage repressor protein C with HTH and peptisase S24 domain
MKKSRSIAIQEQQIPPINLVCADVFGLQDDPELAGLAVVLMRGDSMAPILLNGDYALVDAKQTQVGIGGIFAVLYEQSVVLMQLQPIYEAGGRSPNRVRRVWPNPVYGVDQFTLYEDLQIIGRVVQKVTRHL